MIYLLFVAVFVISSAVFSGVETAFITANPLKVYGKIKNKHKSDQLMHLFANMDQVINTILVGTNISVVSAAVMFSLFFQQWYSFTEAMVLSSSILTIFMLVFAEILPKAFCLKHSESIVRKFGGFVRVFIIIFFPISIFLKIFNRLLMRSREKEFISREEVEFVFYDEQKDKNTDENEKDFIYRVLNLSDIKVKEGMIPLNRIAAVSLNATREEVTEKLRKHFYSRLPVYKDEIYNLVGYIPVQRFLFQKEKGVKELLKETLFFPEIKPADEALFEMQKAKKPLCFLVDEYGAVSGMLTKEDMAELIVGNIEDEIHREEEIIINENGILVPGDESIEVLNQTFNLNIDKKGFETVSGFVTAMLKKIPSKDDSFVYKGYLYTVEEAGQRVAKKISIQEIES